MNDNNPYKSPREPQNTGQRFVLKAIILVLLGAAFSLLTFWFVTGGRPFY